MVFLLQQPKHTERDVYTGMPHFIALHFISLLRCGVFYKSKARPFTSKKDYNLLYWGGLESNLQHLWDILAYNHLKTYQQLFVILLSSPIWAFQQLLIRCDLGFTPFYISISFLLFITVCTIADWSPSIPGFSWVKLHL